jgi:hypothetical protein
MSVLKKSCIRSHNIMQDLLKCARYSLIFVLITKAGSVRASL